MRFRPLGELLERLENRCLLAADIELLSPGTANFHIENSSRLGGIAVSVGDLDANGQQTFITQVLMTTGATHVNNQPLDNNDIFGTKVYLRDIAQANVASAYEFIGPDGYRYPSISANGRYVAEVIPGGTSASENWFLPLGEAWHFHAGIRLDPNAPNGQYYPAGYYFESGAYYASYGEVPKASGFSDFRYATIRVTDREANTFFYIGLENMLEVSVTSVSDNGDVAYVGDVYSIGAVPSPFTATYYQADYLGRQGAVKFKNVPVSQEVNGTPYLSAHENSINRRFLASITGSNIVLTDLDPVLGGSKVIDPYTSVLPPPAPTSLDISADGRYIVFTSSRGDLVAGDTNNKIDVFRYDSQRMAAPYFDLVSKNLDGIIGNADSQTASISDDGRFIAFSSLATSLTDEFTSPLVSKVYVKDMLTGRVLLANSSLRDSSNPHISGSGEQVAFELGSFVSGGYVADVYGFYNSLLTNLPPVVSHPLVNASLLQGTSFSFVVPEDTFSDPDDTQNLVLTATLQSGAPLPAWLTFASTTRRFSGTPSNSDVGSLAISVAARDRAHATAVSTFTLRVDDLNEPPLLANALADASVPVRFPLLYSVASSTFSDEDLINGDFLNLSAQLSDGTALPSWLTFYPAGSGEGTLVGTPPAGTYSVDTPIPIRISATDRGGVVVFDDVTVTVTVPPIRPVPTTVYVDGSWYPGDQLDPDGSAGPAQELFYDAFRDLQEAIDAVASGGLVVVHSGRYANGNINGGSRDGGAVAISNKGKPLTISPGAGPSGNGNAQVIIGGGLTLDAQATLRMSIGDPEPETGSSLGVDFDQIVVFNGIITLENPALTLAGSHVPRPSDLYELLRATSISLPANQLIVGQFAATGSDSLPFNGGFVRLSYETSVQPSTVRLAHVDSPPTSITLVGNTIPEDSAGGALVGTLGSTDPDTNDSALFSLINDASDRFQLSGNRVEVKPGALLDFETTPNLTIRVAVVDSFGARLERDLSISLTNVEELKVQSVDVNGSQPGTSPQRSMVKVLTVTFNGLATISAGAFEVVKTSAGVIGSDGVNTGPGVGAVGVSVVMSVIGGNSLARLTFNGAFSDAAGSLLDGNYRLTIRADKIFDSRGVRLDGNGDGIVGDNRATDTFFRLFGDTDGDRDVDNLDSARFRNAFGKTSLQTGYLWYLDFDSNGVIDELVDNRQFKKRIGKKI